VTHPDIRYDRVLNRHDTHVFSYATARFFWTGAVLHPAPQPNRFEKKFFVFYGRV
jgi:hypothetical protein